MDPESESKPSERDDSRSSSASDSSDSDSDDAPPQVEWLATARERRSTAGNRMKSMLANEEPDSDLELLFAEDDDDQGFSDVDAGAGSDVQMDSSSDDEDENNAGDDDEGEKELERQAREARRAAQRKRKAHETAIPAKFRKKVRIDPTTTSGPAAAPAAPPPRPKKKSERASWLPSAADMPTRASSRQTTRLSKEQLHQQMVEREARRLKQVAQMEKKAARMEALKKPPMTQEERLREAAAVERRNAKSLNRWEVAERQREEERLAKLAALNQRTLKGPVLTFWSGWVDGKLANMGRHFVLEEKPKKKKEKDKDKSKGKDKPGESTSDATVTKDGKETGTPVGDATTESKETKPDGESLTAAAPTPSAEPKETESQAPSKEEGSHPPAETVKPPRSEQTHTPSPAPEQGTPPLMAMPPMPPPPQPHPPSGLAAPAPEPAHEPETQGRLVSPPDLSHPQEPRPSGVLAAPMLAPPPGISINGTSQLGHDSTATPKSSVLALPDTSQQAVAPPSLSAPASATKPSPPAPAEPVLRDTPLQPIQNQATVLNQPANINTSEPPPESSSPSAATTRNAIVYQNFDENAIRDKSVQTQILFGRKMTKLSKPSPTALCVITNHPARYRDPQTGLPYHNAQAYREIQRLRKGDYKWSRLLGAWVGSGTYAARGVPERFLNPNWKKEEKKEEKQDGEKPEVDTKEQEKQSEKQDAKVKAEEVPGQAPSQPVVDTAQTV